MVRQRFQSPGMHRQQQGFTLLEVLTVTAIIGVLLSVAVPYMQNYTIQARVSEGLLILGELRRRVETEFYERGDLTSNIPFGAATGRHNSRRPLLGIRNPVRQPP